MSKIRFLNTPFPDNHNGFDYSPASYMDVKAEESASVRAKHDQKQANKLMSLFASIFK